VSAEEKANLPVDRVENFLLFLNEEPDLRAFWLVPVESWTVK